MNTIRSLFRTTFIVCVLLWATLNALSWFAWSWHFMGLFIRAPQPPVGIGFPLPVWTSEATAENFVPNITAMLLDLACGIIASSVIAAIAVSLVRRGLFPAAAREAETTGGPQPAPRPQYSLRSLLLATTIVSVLLAIIKYETDPVRGALVLICVAGPGMIALAGYLTRRFGDRFSSRATLVLMVLLMIAAAVLGETLQDLQDFTRALMALFVCWTPQFVLIALGLKVVQYAWGRNLVTREEQVPEM